MALVPLLIAIGLLGLMPIWFVPTLALVLAWWSMHPGSSLSEVALIGGAVGLAAPLSVGLAGAILDRVCVAGALVHRGGVAPLFRTCGLVLGGAILFQSSAPFELMVTVRDLMARGDTLDLWRVVAKVGAVVCFCGGLLALVALGAIVLVELPLRWCTSASRVAPLDLSLSALRPLIVVGVAAVLFHLATAFVLRETAPGLLGGIP